MKGAKLIDWQWAWPDKDPDYKKISKYMMQVLNNNVTIGASLHVPDEWGSYGSVNPSLSLGFVQLISIACKGQEFTQIKPIVINQSIMAL